MLIDLHPLAYFRAKAFLSWLVRRLPGQVMLSEMDLEKRCGPIRIWLYRHVWSEEDCAEYAELFPSLPKMAVASENEVAQISIGPVHIVFELADEPGGYTAFTLEVTT